ncbi:MAG TPA: glycosyltransferase family 2 protein [Acidobacteriaceae bacterium]|jgi:glycosyltransferase involved in cell wall biosynthesis|nr:glycosyltransferase family 2 protein [Acidobacteriaceae bacterium]
MQWLNLVAYSVSQIVLIVWTQRAVAAQRQLPCIPNLLKNAWVPHPGAQGSFAQQGGEVVPRLTVIVPARNEAAAIEATLRSLLAQTIPVEIIAVDDRSTDATGALMDSLSTQVPGEGRAAGKFLSVIHIDALPPGWMGKTHAMALAARQSATPWLLFTDGDIVFQPDTLERALRYAEHAAVDHLVLLPTLILKTPGERMMSAVFQSLSLLTWRPWKIADPKAKHESIGMGAFNLVHSDVYRAIGGFEALSLEVLEDLRLGYEIKHHGYRQHLVLGPGLIQLHWAPGVFGMVHNLTKNIYATFRFRLTLFLGAWLGLLIMCFVPFAGLFGNTYIRVVSVLSLLMIALLYQQASRFYNRIGPIYTLTFPIAAALVLYAMLRSALLTLIRRGIVWRGTFYPLKELRRRAGPLR